MQPAAAISYILGGTDGISNEDAVVRVRNRQQGFSSGRTIGPRKEIAGDLARELKSSKGGGEKGRGRGKGRRGDERIHQK